MSKERCGCVLRPEGLPPELEELARLRHEEVLALNQYLSAMKTKNEEWRAKAAFALDEATDRAHSLLNKIAEGMQIAS